jgi:hypothetical protein
MALSTAVSAVRPPHRTARLGDNAYGGALALDWANGQALTLGASSVQSTAFDTANDRIVMVSVGGGSGVVGAWIAVGANPTATAGAGNMWIPQQNGPVPVYVPAGMLIAGLQGATAGTLSLIPALIEY